MEKGRERPRQIEIKKEREGEREGERERDGEIESEMFFGGVGVRFPLSFKISFPSN